ncbi:FAD binding domain-containing protein [Streptomonospora arabica]|uniref:FAD binding domain-containing protein n=1 Tax=Streptomonospora arabica TaxID=412417 RepID=A0ABV9SJ70_9ACTN
MKPAPFDYVRPARVEDAVAELAAADGGGKVIAGGQSLMPVLAMRLARPETLVDVNAIAELADVREEDGALRIGATARQRRLEREPGGAGVPLLGMALPWVGHRELRSRGTVCGSLAHADPAAELPAVACCLDGVLTLAGPAGDRDVPARDFFTGAMTTALGHAEVVRSVRLPRAAPGDGFGFAEVARRHGDFALAGVAVHVSRSSTGGGAGVARASVTAFGVSDRPVTRDAAALLATADPGGGGAAEAAARLSAPLAQLAEEVVDTAGDAHGSPGYRKRLFATLAARELVRAYRRAERGTAEVST